MSRSEIFAVVSSALIVAIVIVAATVVIISEIITPARDRIVCLVSPRESSSGLK